MDPAGIELNGHGHRALEKSARQKDIFVNMVASVAWKCKCEVLIFSFNMLFRPEFIFGQVDDPTDLLCLNWHVRFLGTVKLIMFFDSITSSLFVPCLTCDEKVSSGVRKLSLLGIHQMWDAQNRDLHRYLTFLPMLVKGKCSVLQNKLVTLVDFDFCPVATISEMYNLSLLDYQDRKAVLRLREINSFGCALLVFHYDYGLKFRYNLYQVDLRPINFLAPTYPPSAESGVATFVSPFNLEGWCCLLISVISVAAFLTILGIMEGSSAGCNSMMSKEGKRNGTRFYCVILMVEKVITVTIIFLGQVRDSSGRSYRNGKVAILLMILWLFGNLFLVQNFIIRALYTHVLLSYFHLIPLTGLRS